MSNVTEIDYSLWVAYLADCKASEMHPTTSDYVQWLAEANLDRKEYYDEMLGADSE